MSADRVYAKTDKGRAELQSRTGTLRGRLRAALIVVNGQAPLSALQAVIGDGAASLLDELRSLGHVEAVDPAAQPVSGAGERPVDALLEMRRADAMHRLAPHFGPDVALIARPLLAAEGAAAFNHALDAIERKLALYMGRRDAARTLAGLKLPT
ncbi:hypothetical protein NMQ14_14320 [Methyloversatilis sp. XJ19-13]|uniref:hypothetical protein n=1 Tax=Methyloversatilis sp. XJ19-13 TaxID=2963430 RepID=UPI00211CAC81|nr:hypothetical protein [Methyloversatilis sp. XJ19-13]MCQ9375429.1 hypothetical protein [Methyloversatilis sp. XJ19-13]